MGSKTKLQYKAKSEAKVAMIKGYIPLRLSLSLGSDERTKFTFMYVREHKQNTSSLASLFVVNAPMIPEVHTNLFLHFLFSKFGEVEKAIVVRNPVNKKEVTKSVYCNLNKEQINSSVEFQPNEKVMFETSDNIEQSFSNLFGFHKNEYDEGKYAHVVFVSKKEMRKALQSIRKLHCEISISREDISKLVAESNLLNRKEEIDVNDEESDSSDENMSKSKFATDVEESSLSSVARLVEKRRRNLIPRSVLMNQCNAIMEKFEEEEEISRKKNLSNEPDEDGFVTVRHSNAVGSKRELEENNQPSTLSSSFSRRKGNKRSRKKKDGVVSGSSELKDFYRFQMRETRQKNIEELRSKFEEDLKEVKKMKEQKLYKPF